jgi:hypothetical protein
MRLLLYGDVPKEKRHHKGRLTPAHKSYLSYQWDVGYKGSNGIITSRATTMDPANRIYLQVSSLKHHAYATDDYSTLYHRRE